jgi:hypothetical protein
MQQQQHPHKQHNQGAVGGQVWVWVANAMPLLVSLPSQFNSIPFSFLFF